MEHNNRERRDRWLPYLEQVTRARKSSLNRITEVRMRLALRTEQAATSNFRISEAGVGSRGRLRIVRPRRGAAAAMYGRSFRWEHQEFSNPRTERISRNICHSKFGGRRRKYLTMSR